MILDAVTVFGSLCICEYLELLREAETPRYAILLDDAHPFEFRCYWIVLNSRN